MHELLLLSLLSPVAEAFPNLYMSWWTPSNGRIRQYLDHWPRRVVIVCVVWLPILITLAGVPGSRAAVVVIAVLVFSAFGLRLHLFDRHLGHELDPTRRNDAAANLSRIPEVIYVIAFASIGVVLYSAVPDDAWLVPVAIGTIFLGAFMMAAFRRGERANLRLDVVGRFVFIIGFLINLYNVHRAS